MTDRKYPQIIGSVSEKPYVPEEADDTLRSGSTAKVIELLCEGPVEGFAGDPKTCIFLDDTPVRSSGLPTSTWTSTALIDFWSSSNYRYYVTNIQDVMAHVATSDTIEFPIGRTTVVRVVEDDSDPNHPGYNGYIEVFPRIHNTTQETTTTYSVTKATYDNFKDFTYRFSLGTPDTTGQQPLLAFDSVANYVTVGAPLLMPYPDYAHRPSTAVPIASLYSPNPVMRQIDNIEVSKVNVIVQIDALWIRKTNGDTEGYSAEFDFEVRTDATNWKRVTSLTLRGKCRNPVQKSVLITLPDVPANGPTYRQIRVTKVSGFDSGRVDHLYPAIYKSAGGNSTLAGYTEIVEVQQTYPNTAVISFKVSADQFSSIPSRKYLMNLLKVSLPTGYVPRTPRGYIGTPVTQATYPAVWDGTFTGFSWSDNPVWCLRDLLLSKRYGLGRYLDAAHLDDYALYQAARYCDELVPNGAGGTEPRFTLNCIISSKDQALTVVRNILLVLRGMGLWNGSQFAVMQDRPSLGVTMQYSPANVENGMFHYSGSSINQRHTAVVVAWVDPAQQYKTDYEYVEDLDGIERYGVKKLELTAFGCTSRGQARRVGKWTLLSELYEREQVSFTVGLDSMLVMPGDIIQITDPNRLASPTNAGDESDRLGGRLLGATASVLKLDSPVTLLVGEIYKLSVLLPDGTVEDQQCHIRNTLPTAGGSGDDLQVLAPFSQTPATGAIWLLYRETLKPFLARVMSVGAAEGDKYTITAQQYHPDKYAAVDSDTQFDPAPTSSLPDPGFCPPPTNLQATEVVYTTNTGLTFADIEVTWDVPATGVIAGYEVAYRGGKVGSWTKLPRVSWPLLDIKQVEPADYDIQVVAYNFAGKASVPVMVSVSATGKTTPPADPMSFVALGQVMQISLRWTYADEPDIKLVELWASTSPNQLDAIKLTDLAFPQDTYTHMGLGLNVHMHYWMRVKDTSGQFSGWTSADAVTSSDPTEYVNLMQNAVNRSMLVRDLLQDIDNPALALLDLSGRVSWMSDMLRDLKTKSDAVIEVDPSNGAIRLKTMAKVDSLAAAVRQEIQSRVDGDLVLSGIVTDIGSNNDDVAAAIHEESVARVQGLQALATQQTTLGVANANLKAAVDILAEAGIDAATGQARAVYEVRVQTLSNGNKVIAGFGLASEPTGSEFVVMADKFHVVAPGSTTARQLFSIDSTGGTPVAVINGDFVTLGTISAGALVSADMTVKSGGFIESDNYDATHGWHLSDTEAILNNCTVRGTLAGATGTFGGSLTATAINAVDTINIAGNAVTIPVVSALASPVTVAANGTDTWQAATPVLSATFNNNSSNSVTLVTHWSVQTQVASGGDYTSKQYAVLDGVASFGMHAAGIGNNSPDNSTGQFNFVTVNPGVHTIELRVQLFGDINGGPSVIAGRMFVMGAKK